MVSYKNGEQEFIVQGNLSSLIPLVGWSARDVQNVRQVSWDIVADQVVPLFYERIKTVPALDRIIRSYTTYDRLRETLRFHIEHLVDDPLDSKTVVRLQETSARHLQIGLSTEWFFSTYWQIFQSSIHKVMEDTISRRNALEIIDSVLKRLSLDIMVMSTVQSSFYTFHDLLTQSPNRLATQMQLDAFVRTGQPFILLFADLNGFKAVNDTFGHEAGDNVLVTVAERWRAVLRHSDWMGRWGGDEFLFLLPEHATDITIAALIKKLLSVFDSPITIPSNPEVSISASFGHAMFPEHGTTVTALLHHADRHLYEAKQSDQRWVARDVGDGRHSSSWVDRIQSALDQERLEVHYQPIIGLHDHADKSWEALVRYRDANGGVHLPAEFFPALRHSALMSLVDKAVLRQVFRDLDIWHAQAHSQQVSVNVTIKDILNPDWFDHLAQLHTEFPRVVPTDLTFEIRESMTVVDVDHVVEALRQLRDLGYRVALDDFGTGYSSLSRLQRLPINSVKIDASFIQQWECETGRTLIQAVVGLSRPMDFTVVAEGVETMSQREALKNWGCNAIQGWIYSPAREAKEVVDWVNPLVEWTERD